MDNPNILIVYHMYWTAIGDNGGGSLDHDIIGFGRNLAGASAIASSFIKEGANMHISLRWEKLEMEWTLREEKLLWVGWAPWIKRGASYPEPFPSKETRDDSFIAVLSVPLDSCLISDFLNCDGCILHRGP